MSDIYPTDKHSFVAKAIDGCDDIKLVKLHDGDTFTMSVAQFDNLSFGTSVYLFPIRYLRRKTRWWQVFSFMRPWFVEIEYVDLRERPLWSTVKEREGTET